MSPVATERVAEMFLHVADTGRRRRPDRVRERAHLPRARAPRRGCRGPAAGRRPGAPGVHGGVRSVRRRGRALPGPDGRGPQPGLLPPGRRGQCRPAPGSGPPAPVRRRGPPAPGSSGSTPSRCTRATTSSGSCACSVGATVGWNRPPAPSRRSRTPRPSACRRKAPCAGRGHGPRQDPLPAWRADPATRTGHGRVGRCRLHCKYCGSHLLAVASRMMRLRLFEFTARAQRPTPLSGSGRRAVDAPGSTFAARAEAKP